MFEYKITVLETLENGKSIRETRDIDIPGCRNIYHQGGEVIEEEFTNYRPIGLTLEVHGISLC